MGAVRPGKEKVAPPFIHEPERAAALHVARPAGIIEVWGELGRGAMRYVVALIASFAVTGCATVVQGTTQLLSFNIEPREARCVLARVDDGELGTVSGTSRTISVTKDKDDIVVSCSAPGYLNKTTRIVSAASGGGVTSVFLNDFGITDLATGAFWKYPETHSISLEREASQAQGGTEAPAQATYPDPRDRMNLKVEPEPEKQKLGRFTFEVEQLARRQRCATSPTVTLTASGTGFEQYSVPCTNGDALAVRCDLSNCRVLK